MVNRTIRLSIYRFNLKEIKKSSQITYRNYHYCAKMRRSCQRCQRAPGAIAGVCQEYPGSSQAFSSYMAKKLTVEQIGYCERVAESAVQYAQRLLAKKPTLASRAEAIAKQLVYEYKDHGFVVDIEEARSLLSDSLIFTGSPEGRLAEKLHQRPEIVNMYLGIRRKRHLAVVGILDTDIFIRRSE